MPGRRRSHYTGATGSISLSEARQLGRRWAVQEKVDGMFVSLYLNGRGRVERVFSGANRDVHRNLLDGIRGALLGRPHAELIGELEASTEAGNAAAAGRGQRLVHLFDCLHDGTRSLAREPYRVRRDALWRMQSEVVNYGPQAPWLLDADGRARERSSGRYTYHRLMDWRVAPIVEQHPIGRIDALWSDLVKDRDGEGLVLVSLDAPAGARRAKLKLKPVDTIDCVVLAVDKHSVSCIWNGHVFVAARRQLYVEPGNVVAVAHNGWYERGVTPKFARLIRVRHDLLL